MAPASNKGVMGSNVSVYNQLRGAEKIENRYGADDRGCLEQQNELVPVARQREPERLRHPHQPESHVLGQSERPSGIDLCRRHDLKRTAEDFRLIRCGVQSQSENAAEPGVLVVPAAYDRPMQGISPYLDVAQTFRGISRLTIPINDPDVIVPACRRALGALRRGPRGPVVLAPSHDLLYQDIGERSTFYSLGGSCRSLADGSDVEEMVRILRLARSPLILAGQGVLYAEATPELKELAELVNAPVMTTLNGKSAFAENHPLALGAGGRSRPATVDHFLAKADVVLALGSSLTTSDYITPIPHGKSIIQVTHDPSDIGKCYDVAVAAMGDVKLVIRQLIDRVKTRLGSERRNADDIVREIGTIKAGFLKSWLSRLTSDEVPISPYRVVWDIHKAVDRLRTVVTHDSGNPRDQLVPFYECLVPRGYIGWGKSTQLGTGFGLTLGAKLARPDWDALNIMGDAAFGMIAADIETAVRIQIPITTVVMNNGIMGGYGKFMPVATERFQANRVTGHYGDLARALGAYAETVVTPAEIIPSLRRCLAKNADGHAALLEILTREGTGVSARRLATEG
jgi:thiamine pyrophosphate-dependent acetolactate synthase large subunit-like protein